MNSGVGWHHNLEETQTTSAAQGAGCRPQMRKHHAQWGWMASQSRRDTDDKRSTGGGAAHKCVSIMNSGVEMASQSRRDTDDKRSTGRGCRPQMRSIIHIGVEIASYARASGVCDLRNHAKAYVLFAYLRGWKYV